MTIDAVAAGPRRSRRSSSPLDHRATGRDLRGFVHRGRQLVDARARLRAAGRQPPRAAAAARRLDASALAASPAVAAGRGARARRRSLERARSAASARTSAPGRTTGVLKLVGIPLVGAARDALALRRAPRRPRRERAQPARHAARPGAQGVPRSARCSSAARRAGVAAVLLLPTIFARWRCSGTRDRTRWAPC